MKKEQIKAELKMLKEINELPEIPKTIISFNDNGFVEPPQNVVDYLAALGVTLELLPNGKMSKADFDQLLYKYGLAVPGDEKIISFK